MNGRRLACFFLGAWLASSLLMALLTSQNPRSVDRVLRSFSPAVAAHVKSIGPLEARILLQNHVNEQNRWYMETWCNAQLFAGAGLFFVLLFGTREGRVTLALALAMFVVIVGQRAMLLPEMASLGRLVELLSPEAAAGELSRLRVVQAGYYGLELVKDLVGLAIAAKLIFTVRERSRYAGKNVDLIDKADHRHIDR